MRDLGIWGNDFALYPIVSHQLEKNTKERESMSEKEKKEDENFTRFRKDIENNKKTVLFVGAGVNRTQGQNLLWSDLLNYLLKHAMGKLNATIEERKIIAEALMEDGNKVETMEILKLKMNANQKFSSEVKASIIKQLLGNFYIPLLQEFLYGWNVRSELRKGCEDFVAGKDAKDTSFHSLFSIADFILSHDNVEAVVTYNYDDYLSTAINLLKQNDNYQPRIRHIIHPLDIYSGWKDEPFKTNCFAIYHIHGMIQPNNKVTPHCSNQVVLSLEEYYDMARDTYSWHSATQLFYLTHYTCAFIGASLADMTMQRVLHYANLNRSGENVYYLSAKASDGANEVLEILKNSYLELLGLKVVYDKDGYEHLYKQMNKITQKQ